MLLFFMQLMQMGLYTMDKIKEIKMEQINRKAYQTPLLWRGFKENIIKEINNSQLMMCEIEVIMSEIYQQVQISAQQEYQQALQRQAAELAQGQQEETKEEE